MTDKASISQIPEISGGVRGMPEVYDIEFPFHWVDTSSGEEDGWWKAGIRWQDGATPFDEQTAYADGPGRMLITVKDRLKPKGYEGRVFYTRQFIDPEGQKCGDTRLRVATEKMFAKIAKGYYGVKFVKTGMFRDFEEQAREAA